MKTVKILVGQIGCGKSTYTSKCAKEGYLVFNDDMLVMMLHGGDYSLYDRKLKSLYKDMENKLLACMLESGLNVVIDRPNNKRATRQRYARWAMEYGYKAVYVVFPRVDPVIAAGRRFRSDPRGKSMKWWHDVAIHHEEKYEPIDPAEPYWQIETVVTQRDIEDSAAFRESGLFYGVIDEWIRKNPKIQ